MGTKPTLGSSESEITQADAISVQPPAGTRGIRVQKAKALREGEVEASISWVRRSPISHRPRTPHESDWEQKG